MSKKRFEPKDYVSDNPFRLLCAGSELTLTELEARSEALETLVQSGSVEATTKARIAHALTRSRPTIAGVRKDPRLRIAFRIMWPLSYPSAPGFDEDSLPDFDWLQAQAANSFETDQKQIRFLRQWDQFLEDPSADHVAPVFPLFRAMWDSSIGTSRLTDLLSQEGVHSIAATEAVDSAFGDIAESIMVSISIEAVERWWNGDPDGALAMLEAIANSGCPEAIVKKGMTNFIDLGNEEEVKLISSAANCVELFLESPKKPLAGLNLGKLASHLTKWSPDAARWSQTHERCVSTLYEQVIGASTDLAFRADEGKIAETILVAFSEQPVPTEIVNQVLDYLPEFRKNLALGPSHGGLYSPIKKAPSIGSFYGIGSAMYFPKPCPERPSWHFVTNYFTILFIPIIPMCRYLVADAPGGGWYFFAKAPLPRIANNYKILAVTTFISLAVLLIAWSLKSFQ